jgi:hypothetical protein
MTCISTDTGKVRYKCCGRIFLTKNKWYWRHLEDHVLHGWYTYLGRKIK